MKALVFDLGPNRYAACTRGKFGSVSGCGAEVFAPAFLDLAAAGFFAPFFAGPFFAAFFAVAFFPATFLAPFLALAFLGSAAFLSRLPAAVVFFAVNVSALGVSGSNDSNATGAGAGSSL